MAPPFQDYCEEYMRYLTKHLAHPDLQDNPGPSTFSRHFKTTQGLVIFPVRLQDCDQNPLKQNRKQQSTFNKGKYHFNNRHPHSLSLSTEPPAVFLYCLLYVTFNRAHLILPQGTRAFCIKFYNSYQNVLVYMCCLYHQNINSKNCLILSP